MLGLIRVRDCHKTKKHGVKQFVLSKKDMGCFSSYAIFTILLAELLAKHNLPIWHRNKQIGLLTRVTLASAKPGKYGKLTITYV